MSEAQESEKSRDPSLPEAYWLYGFAANVGISILVAGIWGNRPPLGAMTAWAAYNVFSLWLIWVTSGQYGGRPLWRGLARAAVLIGGAMVALVVLSILSQLAERAQQLEPGKSIMSQLFG